MQVIIIFAVATVVNVVLSTLRSLMTINSGKWGASIVNAICYGFYTWVVVLTVADFDLWLKIAITALANFIGVWVVKFIEEKSRKDKLWKIEMAIPYDLKDSVIQCLVVNNIPYNYREVSGWVMFDCYCENQGQSKVCVDICKLSNGKLSAYESKAVL